MMPPQENNGSHVVEFTGDLGDDGSAPCSVDAILVGPVNAYCEGRDSGQWIALPSRSVNTENEYIELQDVTLYNLPGCYGMVELNDGRIYSRSEDGTFNVHYNIHITQHGGKFYKSYNHSYLKTIPKYLW